MTPWGEVGVTEILVGAAAVEAVWRLRHPDGLPTAKIYTGEFREELNQIRRELDAAVPHMLVRVPRPEPAPTPRTATPPPKPSPSVGPLICAKCGGMETKRPLTVRQRELYDYIAASFRDRGYAPSFDEIAQHMGFSSLATVHEHLTNLESKGWIRRAFNQARAITLMEPAA